jgi:hypothetical protein
MYVRMYMLSVCTQTTTSTIQHIIQPDKPFPPGQRVVSNADDLAVGYGYCVRRLDSDGKRGMVSGGVAMVCVWGARGEGRGTRGHDDVDEDGL